MDTRRNLLSNAWLQVGLVLLVAVLVNTWSARRFTRVDLTEGGIYSLDLVSRALMTRLERPLTARVYFTRSLEAPYNNHEQIVVDKLEDLRAYSQGWMDVVVKDPTSDPDIQEEAKRFGIDPIQQRYQSAERAELKLVWMGVALVYGEKQEVLPAVTDLSTLEYDLARAMRALVTDEERKVIGFATGFGEPDIATAEGPMGTLRDRLRERYNLARVPLGGSGGIPAEVDALVVLAPQKPYTERALYQLDQLVMRGGALGVFSGNVTQDRRSLRLLNVYHGLEPLLSAYGVQLDRALVLDRARNGRLAMPVLEGRVVVNRSINHPLLPRAPVLDPDSLVTRGQDAPLFPFVSSITLADPLPADVTGTVLAATAPDSGRVRAARTLVPAEYAEPLPGEEVGSWPVLVTLSGAWESAFVGRDVPQAPPDAAFGEIAVDIDSPSTRLRESAPTRMVVGGTGDFVANNIGFMLNLVDWMVQDESLISIRAKSVDLPVLDPLTPSDARLVKLGNLLFGPLLLVLLGGIRLAARRRTGGIREDLAAGGDA